MRTLSNCEPEQKVVNDIANRMQDIDERLEKIQQDALYTNTVFEYWAIVRQGEPLIAEQHRLGDQWNEAVSAYASCRANTVAAEGRYHQFAPG